jgi:DNA modification methylase
MCVTSPPYWRLRDYGVKGQIGIEATPGEYVSRMVEVFREVRRVLKNDGTLWLNLGDSYAGSWGNQGRKESRGTQRAINGPMLQKFDGYPAKQPFRVGNSAKNTGVSNRDGVPTPPGLKPKDLVGIPWRVAFALQEDGWYLRSDIIWHKPNPMPESVTDRPTKAHEYLFLLSKSRRYRYDADAISEPCTDKEFRTKGKVRPDTSTDAHWMSDPHKGRTRKNLHAMPGGRASKNRRTVWTITPKPFKGAHFATFPPALIEPCVLAGSGPGDTVLDIFNGAGTTGLVAQQHGREYLGIELNPKYVRMAEKRLAAA